MIIVDIVFVALLAFFLLSGWRNGFLQAIGQLVGAVLGFVAARAWSAWLGGYISLLFPGRPGIIRFFAFIIIFIVVERVVGFLFSVASKLFKIVTVLPIISTVNAVLGAVVGFAEGIVLVGSSTYLVLAFRLDATLVAWLGGSAVARWTERAFFRLLGFLL